ncbi:GntR family transcriptional regulator [Pelagibacterium xiamenense]|uniref:GntR family transcriptional regulator n=1 Tax=Pelagibacterium xiamenense TaxID=2901140 RepID=UPI001E45235F|nr:GntR family transcriptional regulator [Pelagibacterium xiamenense]MCD7060564.1 GntR family transcriptional regulator [Pelagibacterium xiamenense]
MTKKATAYAFLERPEHMPRGSLSSHVTSQLREAIVSLRLKPGTMLDKSEICERLGVSRSPVADALARLQSEGLIDILPQRGSVVSLVSLAAVKEYIFIRTALECETVRKLAVERPGGLVEALEANIARQRDLATEDDKQGFHNVDLQFHEILLNAAGYRRMKAMVDTARNNLDRARHLSNRIRETALALEEHSAIVDAIVKGDPEEASDAMRRHLDSMVESVFEVARQSPTLFSDGELAQA